MQVSGPPEPGSRDIAQSHPVIRVLDLTVDASVVDLNRHATGVRKVLRMKTEDGNVTSLQLANDVVSVRIVVVGDDQNCRGHRLTNAFKSTGSRSRQFLLPSTRHSPSAPPEGMWSGWAREGCAQGLAHVTAFCGRAERPKETTGH
jgi:hypothetical protein